MKKPISKEQKKAIPDRKAMIFRLSARYGVAVTLLLFAIKLSLFR